MKYFSSVTLIVLFGFHWHISAQSISHKVTSISLSNQTGKSQTISQTKYYSTPPAILVSECIFPQKIHVKWKPSGNSSYNLIQTRRSSDSVWTNHFTGSSTELLLPVSGAEPIEYRITSCIDTTQGWTSINTIYLSPPGNGSKPNILVLMLDDARFDAYSCSGPETVPLTPNIDRIANEGANFKNSYVVYSLCDPSRATLFTGLYPHHHGMRNNTTLFYSYLPTLSKTLDTAGYYTAMIGKYLHAIDNNPLPQPGWKYWMAHYKSIDTNPKFMFNDSTLKQINGNINDIVTDSAVKIISTSSDPFFIDLNYATHPPYHADPEDDSLYQSDTFPLPDSYFKFTVDYPGWIYTMQLAPGPDSLEQQYRNMYEVIHSVDNNIGRLFDALEAAGKLDSTLIILTSDNGYMLGEHYLQGKRMCYDENARVPIFIRYPKWFVPGSLDENDFAANIDFAPTILDAAGIPDAFPTDGISLRKILYDEENRNLLYYEVTDVLPTLYLANARSVFSKDYVYNYYFCDNVAEEFFDLTVDPEENINRINYSDYQDLIQQYRDLKDSLKNALTDTVTEESFACMLTSDVVNGYPFEESEIADLIVTPNPADHGCRIEFPESVPVNSQITVTNLLGDFVKTIMLKTSSNYFDLETGDMKAGFYLIRVKSKNAEWNSKLEISR